MFPIPYIFVAYFIPDSLYLLIAYPRVPNLQDLTPG